MSEPTGTEGHPVDASELLARFPPPPSVSSAEVAAAVGASACRVVVLDDDPTGTQTVTDIPVLTRWTDQDFRWGLEQDTSGLFVLTNTRSLSPGEAERRNDEVVTAMVSAARETGIDWVVASRSDSTLRGHFQTETRGLASSIEARAGTPVDGVVVAPAYIDAGRITVDSVHWVRSDDGFRPAATSEYAADATFGYHSSDLRDYVEEKTGGRWKAADVERIALTDIRGSGRDVVDILRGLRGGRPVVVDAASDEDLRAVSLALLDAERSGRRFVYRVGPSFVRARLGLDARPPLTGVEISRLRRQGPTPHGLVVVGSHVPLATRQLEQLQALDGLAHVTVDAGALLAEGSDRRVVGETVRAATAALADRDVVVSTSRQVLTGAAGTESLELARTVSAAVVDIVIGIVNEIPPAWIVAKGGITSSDVATEALGITRAWARGTLLPGIVSLWEPAESRVPGVPYVVFAGNVGDDHALAAVVTTLRSST